jgi:hypothetical protein
MNLPTSSTVETVRRWCAAIERGDADAAAACLAEQVDVISPLTDRFRFHGRQQAHVMLAAAFEVISDIRVHTVVGGGDNGAYAVFYRGRCDTVAVEEAQLLRLDRGGSVVELTPFGRPLPALTAVMTRIGPALARRQRRPALARFLGLATRPLAAVTRYGDRTIVPLADPARSRP